MKDRMQIYGVALLSVVAFIMGLTLQHSLTEMSFKMDNLERKLIDKVHTLESSISGLQQQVFKLNDEIQVINKKLSIPNEIK